LEYRLEQKPAKKVVIRFRKYLKTVHREVAGPSGFAASFSFKETGKKSLPKRSLTFEGREINAQLRKGLGK
ncbi:MAG: hypothetical protein MJZ16_08600, partial [Bacteroidales bacterium]|nr:hypothetical protein [Bacteroidales bacterium]